MRGTVWGLAPCKITRELDSRGPRMRPIYNDSRISPTRPENGGMLGFTWRNRKLSKSESPQKKPFRKLCAPLARCRRHRVGPCSPARLRRGLSPLRGITLVALSHVASAVADPLATGGGEEAKNDLCARRQRHTGCEGGWQG